MLIIPRELSSKYFQLVKKLTSFKFTLRLVLIRCLAFFHLLNAFVLLFHGGFVKRAYFFLELVDPKRWIFLDIVFSLVCARTRQLESVGRLLPLLDMSVPDLT